MKSGKKKSKVLMLLSNAFDPDPRVHQEARALVRGGFELTILCWDRDLKAPVRETIDTIQIERIYIRSTHGRGIGQLFFLLLFWLKAYLKAFTMKMDVIHCHDFDTLPLGYALSLHTGAKLVYDSHESYVDMIINLPKWAKKVIFLVENFFLKRVYLLITVGERLKEAFVERGARNAVVVGNWKDPKIYAYPDRFLAEQKKQFGITNGHLVVSFIANLGTERQLPALIEAVAESPDTFLIIGGNGPCRNLVEKASNQYENISYLGYVHPDKVPLYTAMSDIIFYGFNPSNPNARYSAPNKLFEAIAGGKAVLTGDFGEIGKIVKEDKCGLILDDYSAENIKEAFYVLKTGVLCELKRNSRDAAKRKYSWHMAEKLLIDRYAHI